MKYPQRFRDEVVRLNYAFKTEGDQLIVEGPIEALIISHPEIPNQALAQILQELSKGITLDILRTQLNNIDTALIEDIFEELDRSMLLDSVEIPTGRSGLAALFELEDLLNEKMHETLYENEFWKKCQHSPQDIPANVLYGMAVENYHFLSREVLFDSPALEFGGSANVRAIMNEFFCEEHLHDHMLLEALKSIGVTEDILNNTAPLPETFGLCSALTHWAANDPLFFFVTIGVLEGRGLTSDTFIEACEKVGLDEAFTKPIRNHSNINFSHNHGNMSRNLFAEIHIVDDLTMRRLRSQVYLFVEIYDSFYRSVWDHYSNSQEPMRRILAFVA